MSPYPLRFVVLSVTLVTALGLNVCVFQQLARTQTLLVQNSEDTSPPPDQNKPATSPNITRGECFNIPLIAIQPKQGTLTTTADAPTFLFYIPPLKSDKIISSDAEKSLMSADFKISDQNQKTIYEAKLNLATQSGLLRLSLPASVAELFVATGKSYFWSFQVNCDNTGDLSGSATIEGNILRLPVYTEIEKKLLQPMSAYDRFKLYQSIGLEYDALIILEELRRQNPNDAALTTTWENLLKAHGFEMLIGVPSINFEMNSASPQLQNN